MRLRGGWLETKEAILATITELSNEVGDVESSPRLESRGIIEEKKNIFIDIKEDSEIKGLDSILSDELVLLLRLKEKSLVLFEGLKNSKSENIEAKLEMVLSYLEYQLYMIEDRINSLNEPIK